MTPPARTRRMAVPAPITPSFCARAARIASCRRAAGTAGRKPTRTRPSAYARGRCAGAATRNGLTAAAARRARSAAGRRARTYAEPVIAASVPIVVPDAMSAPSSPPRSGRERVDQLVLAHRRAPGHVGLLRALVELVARE